MKYRYEFDKSSKKFICPSCGKKSFVKYVETGTKNYLSDEFGICDRVDKCGYHKTPAKQNDNWTPPPPPKPKMKPVFYPNRILDETLNKPGSTFIQNLNFDKERISQVIELYKVGSYNGCTTFPFIDINKNIRTIQAKKFDNQNHTTKTSFIHSMIKENWINSYNKNESKVSCLFGEHLLKEFPNNIIGLVEAPKTVIYATCHFGLPHFQNNFLWLAVYNLSSLKYDKVKVLTGRKIVLFPDTSKNGKAFNDWYNKAEQFNQLMKSAYFITSEFLEKYATPEQKVKGYDLADYLTK